MKAKIKKEKEKEERKFIKEPTVKFSQLKLFYEKCDGCTDDTEIPFSVIIGLLFPNIYDNIQKEMGRQYIQGYNEAKERYENKRN